MIWVFLKWGCFKSPTTIAAHNFRWANRLSFHCRQWPLGVIICCLRVSVVCLQWLNNSQTCYKKPLNDTFFGPFSWLSQSKYLNDGVVLGQQVQTWSLQTSDGQFTLSASVLHGTSTPARLIIQGAAAQVTSIIDLVGFQGQAPPPAVFEIPTFCAVATEGGHPMLGNFNPYRGQVPSKQ